MLIVLKMKIVPAFSAALADAHSPSGWAILCMAVGEIPIGIEILDPKTSVFIDLFDTSIIILGLNLYLEDFANVEY